MTLSQVPQGEQGQTVLPVEQGPGDQPPNLETDTQAAGTTPMSPEGSPVTALLCGGQFT